MNLRSASLLLLEDEPLLRRRLAGRLEKLGVDVTVVGTLAEAREALAELSFDFALFDVNLPDGRSLDLMREKRVPSSVTLLVMTAEGGVSGAVEAMQLGAADYLVKPFDPDELGVRLARARQQRRGERSREHATSPVAGQEPTASDLVFTPGLADVRSVLEKIVAADRRLAGGERGTVPPPVLIEGETGTGKTSLARWLHQQGPRAKGPLVEVNCSALPEALAESELFGHEKGAFTDAKDARIGLLEAADGGTLFLDELPSLSAALQAKLLTVLEDHAIRRVGGNRMVPIQTRIIAATNADLGAMVAAGTFREDLLHRLDLFRVKIPPLRERPRDILLLADALAARLAQRYRLIATPIPEVGQARLLGHRWPGNVRELAHAIERSLVFDDDHLTFASLGQPTAVATPMVGWPGGFVVPEEGFSLEETIDAIIAQALRQTAGNVSGAARLLGVPRDYIRYRQKK